MLVSPEMRDGAGGIRSSRASSPTASKPDFESKNKTNKGLKTYQREKKKIQPHGPRGRSAQDYTYFCGHSGVDLKSQHWGGQGRKTATV